tara:strand:- start:220 stop:477 length:258 start_codon:yes stop_codon:yes gene_type:complete
VRLQQEGEIESRTTTLSWFEFNFAIKLLHNGIEDNQPKTNSILIDTMIVFNVTELLEKLVSIIFFDSKTSILDLDVQVSSYLVRL